MPWAIRTLLTISAIALPLYLYITLRSAAAAGRLWPAAKRGARRSALLLMVWLYAFPVLVVALHFLGYTTNRSELATVGPIIDYVFLYPQWISLVIVVELFAPFLLLDAVSFASRFFAAHPDTWRKACAAGRLGLAAAAILYVPVRVLLDTASVQDTTVAIRLKDLPKELRDFRITVVSDIQVDRYTGLSKIGQVHDIVRNQNPELLLSAGDVVTGGTDYLARAEETMCRMRGSLASLAVMGDHDQWSAPETIRDFHEKCGWVFLENDHTVLAWNGKRVLITGLTHIYSRRLKEETLMRILNDAPEADLRVLLVHQPAEWLIRRAAEHGYDIVVAGHTHGGQIVLHPLGVPLTPSMRETEFYSGVYQLGSTLAVVTNGVGLTLAPIRYHAPAEVTTMVLQSEVDG
jgi:predicted MPP superfamily phosphohydrolase